MGSDRIAEEADNNTCPHGNDWESNCEACNGDEMIAYGPIIDEEMTDEERTFVWIERQLTERRNNE